MLFTELEKLLLIREFSKATAARLLGIDVPPGSSGAVKDQAGSVQGSDVDDATFDIPAVHGLPIAKLAALFMISRALRTKDTLQRSLQPGCITIFDGIPPAWINEVEAFLRGVLGRPGRCLTVDRAGRGYGREGEIWTHAILSPEADLPDGVNKAEVDRNTDRILALPLPTFVVCTTPDQAISPRGLLFVSQRLRVEALDGLQIRRILHAAYGRLDVGVAALDNTYSPADLAAAIRPNFSPVQAMRALGQVGTSPIVGVSEATPEIRISLSDLHNMPALQQWAEDLRLDLELVQQGKISAGELSRGVLISGPPGIGKTVACAAIAEHAKIPLVRASVAQWLGYRRGNLGDFCAAVTDSFASARAAAPCLLAIDEIDALPPRGFEPDNNWWDAAVTAVLEALDGLTTRQGVIVMGLCNNVNRLDGALVRAGRFDDKIALELPSTTDLAAILRGCAGPDLEGEDFVPLAARMSGSSAADAARFVRDARRRARREARSLTAADLEAVILRHRRAPPGNYLARVAAHEAGHAVAALLNGFPVDHISLGPYFSEHSDAAGLAAVDFHARLAGTWRDIEATVRVLLAGRAAERIVMGSVSMGATDDLKRATRILALALGSSGLGGTLLWRPVPDDLTVGQLPQGLEALIEEHMVRLQAGVEIQLLSESSGLSLVASTLLQSVFLQSDDILACLSPDGQALARARGAVGGEITE